jgi:TPR repeat protein
MPNQDHPCQVCEKPANLCCSRCKVVWYCGPVCQKTDWKTTHKPNCKRQELVGGRCDSCHTTDNHSLTFCCHQCGFLLCKSCDDTYITGSPGNWTYHPCPHCKALGRDAWKVEDKGNMTRLSKLIKEHPDDHRRSDWMIRLGLEHNNIKTDPELRMAKAYLEKAGELGNGEGYSRLAELYRYEGNWGDVKRFYKKAADLNHVVAIQCLAVEALCGVFMFGESVPPEVRQVPRTSDPKEFFRLSKKAAELDFPPGYYLLGVCYKEGRGTEVNMVKAFKYFKKGAERGDHCAMLEYAKCFIFGNGVEESIEQGRYWLSKVASETDDPGLLGQVASIRELF